MSNTEQTSSTKGISGVVFVGCLMLGFAIGLITGQVAIAFFVALGVQGFIAMGLVRYLTGAW